MEADKVYDFGVELFATLTITSYAYNIPYRLEVIGSNIDLIEPGFYCYIVCPTVNLLCLKEGNNATHHNEYYKK